MSEKRIRLLPHYADDYHSLRRLAWEVWDHLWPWSRHSFRRGRFAVALSFGLATVVTAVWVLAAVGRVASNATLGWWIGWSVFEVLVRLESKPYIKDGPWWGRNYRSANLMDMICYVSFKNLLIAALLFLAIRVLKALAWIGG
ncbi:MAG: transcription regulator [Rhodocyclaceae bacterium]|nr:transcription regulator [Rhodocyclaceae bacterium]